MRFNIPSAVIVSALFSMNVIWTCTAQEAVADEGAEASVEAMPQDAPPQSASNVETIPLDPVTAESEPPSAEDAEDAVMLDDVVVTAEKRADNLQRVPLAVTALTSDQRDLRGIKTVNNIADITPGLSYEKGFGSDRITVRGVGRLTSAIGTDAGVAVYNDGVFTGSGTQIQKSSLFMDRVEVLRGPQGTLYGQNSIGGAINVVSKRPTELFETELRSAYGRNGSFEVEGQVSGALVDSIQGRLATSQTGQGEAYFENIGPAEGLGLEQHRLIEGQLQFADGGPLALWTRISMREWDDRKPSYNLVTPYVTDQFFNSIFPNAAYQYDVENPGVTDYWRVNTNRTGYYQIENNWQAVLEATYDWDTMRVKYLGGWQTLQLGLGTDIDRTSRISYRAGLPGDSRTFTSYDPDGYMVWADSNTYSDVEKTYWSNELNLSSSDDATLRWIGGLYQYYDTSATEVVSQLPGQPQYDQPLTQSSLSGPPTLAAPNPTRDILRLVGDLDITSYAAYGQVDWDFTDRSTLTLGLRYSIDEKQAREQARAFIWTPHNQLVVGALTPERAGAIAGRQSGGLLGSDPGLDTSGLGALPFEPACCTGRGDDEPVYDVTPSLSRQPATTSGPAQRLLSGRWTGLTGRLALDFKASDDMLVYGSYAHGYKAGGFRLGTLAKDYDVEPEQADSFELGLKSDIARVLRTNVALFYNQYRGAQVPLVFDNGLTQDNLFINLDKSRNYGAELEAQWVATRELMVNLTYAWLVAEVQEACCFISNEVPVGQRQPQALDDNRLPFSPEHKAALNAVYRRGFTAGDLVFSGTYVWRSRTHYSLFNDPRGLADAVSALDARVAWIPGQWSVALIGRNLLDETLVTNIELGTGTGPVGFGKTVYVSEPRVFGLELQMQFF